VNPVADPQSDSKELLVLLNGSVIGNLHQRTGTTEVSFCYAPDYVVAGETSLSTRLPIQGAAFPSGRTQPYLAGLLPENYEVRSRWARHFQVSPDDYFGLLTEMGWDCPGAVQFCRPADLERIYSRSQQYVAIDSAAIADRLRELTTPDASWTMHGEHWSLGGQQSKFALAQLDGQWLEAHGSVATTHIFKPGVQTLKYQALVEHLTMRAASFLHIDVAPTTYLQFGEQWAIVVERFDRVVRPDNHITRVHQEDMLQALGRLPEFKYEERKGPGLRDMTQLLNRDSLSPASDRRALADFLIINAVAGAPDGHAKNIALLRTEGGSVFAPLFDLATGLVYESETVERNIALSVGGTREVSKIHRKQWEEAAQSLGLPPEAMIARVENMAAEFPDAFARACTELPDAEGVDQILERVLPRLKSRSEKILSRL